MAEAQRATADNLTCPICFGMVEVPTLICPVHIMCFVCAHRVIQNSASSKRCPVCRRALKVSYEDITSIMLPVGIREMVVTKRGPFKCPMSECEQSVATFDGLISHLSLGYCVAVSCVQCGSTYPKKDHTAHMDLHATIDRMNLKRIHSLHVPSTITSEQARMLSMVLRRICQQMEWYVYPNLLDIIVAAHYLNDQTMEDIRILAHKLHEEENEDESQSAMSVESDGEETSRTLLNNLENILTTMSVLRTVR